MGFLDSVKSMFSGGEKDTGYWIYVRCNRCGEALRTRIDLQNSLSQADEGGYVIHKTLVGSRLCFERIEVTLTFDEGRRLLDRDVAHGEFITRQEYEAAQPVK
jgi:hypothetical protein